jgi:hypothetical protein
MQVRWEIDKKAARLAKDLPKLLLANRTPTTESPMYATD